MSFRVGMAMIVGPLVGLLVYFLSQIAAIIFPDGGPRMHFFSITVIMWIVVACALIAKGLKEG